MTKKYFVFAVSLFISGCIGVIERSGSLPKDVSPDSADKWKIEPGADLDNGAVISGEGMRLHIEANNTNTSYARALGFSPYSMVGFVPVIVNEWKTPADTPHLIITMSVIENSSNLSIDPSSLRLAPEKYANTVLPIMTPLKYSKIGRIDGERCIAGSEDRCETTTSSCDWYYRCPMPNGQKGCRSTYHMFRQSPGVLQQVNSCIEVEFPTAPPDPKYYFSLKIGAIQTGNGNIQGPAILFRNTTAQ